MATVRTFGMEAQEYLSRAAGKRMGTPLVASPTLGSTTFEPDIFLVAITMQIINLLVPMIVTFPIVPRVGRQLGVGSKM